MLLNANTLTKNFLPDTKNKNMDGGNAPQGNQQNMANQQQMNNPGMQVQDPINALQNLATQGTRNNNPQMMNPQANQSGMMQNQQQGNMVQQQSQPPQQSIVNPNPLIRPQNVAQMNQGNMMQQMNQMNPMQMSQMNQNMPTNIPGGQVKPIQQVNPMNQMMGNVQGNMVNQGGQIVVQGNMTGNQQMNNMMNQNQMMMMMNNQNNPIMNQVRPVQNQMGNSMGMSQAQVSQPNPMINSNQQQMQMNIQQMRKQEITGSFPQVRSVTPNFLRQSPSPMSVPSPIGISSAMVPSPQMPNPTRATMSNVAMAPSPSAPMNTPGQPVQSVQSPMNPVDDHIYREKYNRLTKYKEPLKKIISRVGSDGINSEKITKLKKLLEILSNPHTRIPLETLVKCEIVLENQFGALKDTPTSSINNPLYDAIVNSLQTPLGNHILHRTFKPSLEAWFGPDIKNLPPAKKIRLSEEPTETGNQATISHILQREIAKLDSKYKINLDQTTYATGSKVVALICCLDDKLLPPVPPINIYIPEDYPSASPQCNIVDHEYDDTVFLVKVKKALKARISKLPAAHSLTHILETWGLAVRQACNPNYVEPTNETILLAV